MVVVVVWCAAGPSNSGSGSSRRLQSVYLQQAGRHRAAAAVFESVCVLPFSSKC